MKFRPQIDRARQNRPVHDRVGHEGGREAQHPGGEAARPAERPASRMRARRDHEQSWGRAHGTNAKPDHPHHLTPHRAHDKGHRRQGEGDARAPHTQHLQRPEHPPRSERLPESTRPRQAQQPYAFTCAGHQVRFGPVAFWTVVGTLVIMAGWSIVTASYFAFHDDVITRLIVHQADVQAAYEDRLADMRAQVDRVISRQLLDQEQFEQKLDRVVRRQSVLERRAGALSALGDPSITGSIKRQANKPGIRLPKPSPIRETGAAPRRGKRQLNRLLRPGSSAKAPGPGPQSKLARLMRSLDEVEQRQIASLEPMEKRYDGKVRRIQAALAKLGIKSRKAPKAGAGGPFVPVKMADNDELFEQRIRRIRLSRKHLDRLSKTLLAVPVRRPVSGKMRFSSNFGMRLDPFLRRPAMHTGLDFRGDRGDPIRATAIGRVVSARWSGGYGRMIEIDHGKGLSTRYGHLSRTLVRKGQKVRIGQTIGRMGSTGRSTGPHLHYETRIDGKPVNPKKFLAAGRRLGLL